MAFIPYQSTVDARTGRSGGARLRNAYDANALGAAAGQALERVGASIDDAGDAQRRVDDNKNKEQQVYAESMFDPSKEIDAVKQSTDADATGYTDEVRKTYLNKVSDYTNGIENDEVRTKVKEALIAKLPGVTSDANSYELKVREDTTKQRTNATLDSSRNKVLTDPSAYDDALTLGKESIDVYGAKLPVPKREEMKNQFGYDLAKNRFQGMIEKAKSPAELDGITAQMSSDEWQPKVMGKDYEDLNNKIISTKKAMQSQLSSEVTSTLTNLEERSVDPTVTIPKEDLVAAQSAVGQSGNVNAQTRMARIVRNTQLVSNDRKLTPAQLQSNIDARKAQNKDTGGSAVLPPELGTAVNNAAEHYGISASYLESTINREYGTVLKSQPGKYDAGPGGDSTASGPLQFTKDTFLNLVKDPVVAVALGIKASAPEAEVLAMRNDPAKAVEAGAILAKQNKAALESSLGRPVNDTELYMAHFLGAPQATAFLKMQAANQDATAATAFPKEADANPGVFFADPKTKQKPFTVAQVYNNIGKTFTSTASRVQYDDIQVEQKLLDNMQTALKGPDGLKYAASVGTITLTPLDQDGAFPARGKAWNMANTYYGREFKPLTTDEEAYVTKQVQDGSAKDVTNMMAGIQSMGPEAARATFAQLNVKNPAFAHAGQLALNGDPATAADVIRGYKRLKENPAVLTTMGVKPENFATDFASAVGPSLSRIPPDERQAAQEAATALLVETKQGASYSSDDYKKAVAKVLGNRIDEVNGEKTFLPSGVKGADVEKAIGLMTMRDYIAMSPTGSMPLHANGEPINPEDGDELKLRAVGDDKYALADSDGSFLWNGRVTDGQPDKYIMELKPDRIRSILQRKVLAAN